MNFEHFQCLNLYFLVTHHVASHQSKGESSVRGVCGIFLRLYLGRKKIRKLWQDILTLRDRDKHCIVQTEKTEWEEENTGNCNFILLESGNFRVHFMLFLA